jgi:DNA modification methylase
LEPTIDLYVEHTVMIFREVRRLLTRDGTLWLNLGDSHASGKGSCFNPGGGETRYKDYRKEAGVIRLRRLNLSEVRDQGLKPKDLCGIPWRVAFALQADGWWVRSDIIWHKPNPMPESVTDRCTKAHEYIFMLAKSADYYFDAEAIKEQQSEATFERFGNGKAARKVTVKAFASEPGQVLSNSDYKTKCPDAIMPDGKRNKRSVWTIPTQGTKDAHFATFPPKLIEPMILAGCPKEVCVACGKPRERIVEKIKRFESGSGRNGNPIGGKHGSKSQGGGDAGDIRKGPCVHAQTVNWSDCGCGRGFRPGVVLDPFAGTGTIGQVAAKLKRDYLLIEIKQEYVDQIARYKLDEVEIALPVKKARKGQKALFENI